jgi:L-arabinokinase
VERTVPIPEDIAFWGIDSGVRHSVSGADYGSVRVGAFMGYRVLADLAGLEVTPGAAHGTVAIEDPQWNGYLANVSPSEWEQTFASRVPENLVGAEFLERYRGTTDPITRVDPARSYAVRVPTAHPIYENFRVRAFAELMAAPEGERRRQVLGELMFQSHASYSACGLGSGATDRLVELVRQIGPDDGLYGAKITGGGSGGTVAVLSRRDAEHAIREVAARFEQETGHRPYVFRGSSPGACAFGTLRLDSIDGAGLNKTGQEK